MMQAKEICTPEDWLRGLYRWKELLVRGDREAETLWQALDAAAIQLSGRGEFLPVPYLSTAFRLTEDQTRCLCLALVSEQPPALTAVRALLPEGTGLRREVLTGRFAGLMLDREALEEGVLRVHDRLADFALGGQWNDPDREGLTLLAGAQPPRGLQELTERTAQCFRRSKTRLTYLLLGQEGAGRRTLALGLAQALDTPLLSADGRYLLGREAESFRRALLREAWLQHCPVLLTDLDSAVEEAREDREAARALEKLLEETAEPYGLSLLSCQEEWGGTSSSPDWTCLPVALALPDPDESRRLWAEFTGEEDLSCTKYRLTPGQMQRAVRDARALAAWTDSQSLTPALLEQGCRRQLRHGLGEKARRVETVFTWDSLILPESSKSLLRSACQQVRYRSRVYDRWGFGARLPYGGGLSMLFSGPPGTGKTMGAQVVAGTLGLELYRVELPAVVSKYVGETEKNLSLIFREAAKSQAILFFDEADVLFGKRTEQKDAQDKYSNMEAAYLLQKMEDYPGISILATNYLENFDEAFKRRLTFIIPFPFPDRDYRLRLWNAVFPPETPVEEDVDREFLARQFELSGSAIKNVALSAAFLAAGENTAVTMAHLLTALCREVRKSGKTVSREELGPYYILLEEGGHGA